MRKSWLVHPLAAKCVRFMNFSMTESLSARACFDTLPLLAKEWQADRKQSERLGFYRGFRRSLHATV